uniref:Uncharacterized protein n=1 Tax=Anguilla anguilla TaxID=7936 RepID=A0A0E9UZF3_ANGAN
MTVQWCTGTMVATLASMYILHLNCPFKQIENNYPQSKRMEFSIFFSQNTKIEKIKW